MAERKDPLAHLVPRDGLRDVDILILDAFAVAGGSASRDQAFDLIERKLWGHMAGADARQTFDDAVDRLLQQGALVPWGTERLPTLALPPRPYELPPRLPGGKPYIPGTEYWAGERQMLLSEVHRQLAVHLQQVEAMRAKFLEEFGPERARLLEVIKRQISRRQMDTTACDEMIVALSKLLLSTTEIAAALALSESDVNRALTRNRDAARKRDASPRPRAESSVATGEQPSAIVVTDVAIANSAVAADDPDIAIAKLIRLVRRKGGTIMRSEIGHMLRMSTLQVDELLEDYGNQYPGCVNYVAANGQGSSGYKTVIHAPPEEASA